MELSESYRRSVDGWSTTVSGVRDAWDQQTPCGDWDVRALVNHVVGEDRWTVPLVERKTLSEVGDAFDGDLLGADPIGTVEDAAAAALTAVAEQLPGGGTVNLSYGDEDIAEYIRQLTADHLIHGWDLAAATGQDRVLDAEVVAEVAAWFAEREDLYRGAGMIAERPAAFVGDPQADLLIAFGREPNWPATG